MHKQDRCFVSQAAYLPSWTLQIPQLHAWSSGRLAWQRRATTQWAPQGLPALQGEFSKTSHGQMLRVHVVWEGSVDATTASANHHGELSGGRHTCRRKAALQPRGGPMTPPKM